jgi:aspartyl/asparaginyl-tRNA synthetase
MSTTEPTNVPAPAEGSSNAEPVPVDAEGKPLSKNAIKKLAKEKEKAEKAALRAQKEEEQRKQQENAPDTAKENYGVLPMNQSTERDTSSRVDLSTLNAGHDNTTVVFRARIHNARAQSAKLTFLVLRQKFETIQSVIAVNADGTVSKQMTKWAAAISPESVVLVHGIVKKAPEPIKSATISELEIHIQKLYVIDASEPTLPLQLEDASQPEVEDGAEGADHGRAGVSLKTKLDNRFLDLRTATNQAIFRISSGVCTLFREYLLERDFIEIHTPKLIGAASEGGANVFEVKYFDRKAYLAQSPQFYKQMFISGCHERVFEIGPVFRAENSNSHRHMTEVS